MIQIYGYDRIRLHTGRIINGRPESSISISEQDRNPANRATIRDNSHVEVPIMIEITDSD
jgi:hypothetical protein